MYRAVANFTVNGNYYEIGDTIRETDNDAIQGSAHLKRFVVAVSLSSSNFFASPN